MIGDKVYTVKRYYNVFAIYCNGAFFATVDKESQANRIAEELNKQEEVIKELNQYSTACDDTLLTIQELTYKIISMDFKDIKTKSDYSHLLNEMDNKDLAFLHDCFKAIRDCDLSRMNELKNEKYGGIL